jgi:hypothetical protein
MELQILRIGFFKPHLRFAFLLRADGSDFIVMANTDFVISAVGLLSFKEWFCVFFIPVSG